MTHPTETAASVSRYSARSTAGPIVVAVGTDRSAPLRAAERIARRSGASVLAVAVAQPTAGYVVGSDILVAPPEVVAGLRNVIQERLGDDVARTVAEGAGWRVGVLQGDPASEIAALAREERAPLIVMGIGHHALIDRLLGDETTLRTIHRASCPVLAVAPGAPALRTVLVATDFSATSAYALECARPMLEPGAMVYCVHAWRPVGVPDEGARAIDRAYRRSLPDRFARFANAVPLGSDVRVTFDAREGATASAILDFAAAHDVDAIIAGRHGGTALERMFVGSVTTNLLRRAHCSMFVAPAPEFADVERIERLLTGRVESATPAEWTTMLDAFTRRNGKRPGLLRIGDPTSGPQALIATCAFVGAAYDPKDAQVALMFGVAGDGASHVTHRMAEVRRVTVVTSWRGLDTALEIEYDGTRAVLAFDAGAAES